MLMLKLVLMLMLILVYNNVDVQAIYSLALLIFFSMLLNVLYLLYSHQHTPQYPIPYILHITISHFFYSLFLLFWQLDKWTAVVKPVSVGKVIPLGERDILSDGTALYQLVLGVWCVVCWCNELCFVFVCFCFVLFVADLWGFRSLPCSFITLIVSHDII